MDGIKNKRITFAAVLAALLVFMFSCTVTVPPEAGGVTQTEKLHDTDASPEKRPPLSSDEQISPPRENDAVQPELGFFESVIPVSADLPYTETDLRSPYTGLPSSVEALTKRPCAIMINNERKCLPQTGISKASILFECNIEGGVNRMIGIFEDYEDIAATGPVRSCRPYFLDVAQMHDAIYIHAGGSQQAYVSIKERGINNIDAVNDYMMEYLNVFWRDPVKYKQKGYEHSLFITGPGIVKALNYKKYRTLHQGAYESPYHFNPERRELPSSLSPKECTSVVIPHSAYIVSSFDYNAADGKYYKSIKYPIIDNVLMKHIDEATGEQLSFENLLIVFTDRKTVDDYGRLDVKITGTGMGYYAAGGKYVPIKWQRDTIDSVMNYYDQNGSPLFLNPGKTFISIASTGIMKNVSIG